MNKQELDHSLEFISNPNGELQLIIYACFPDLSVKKLDVKSEDLPPIRQLFIDSIKSQILEKEGISIIPLSTADERANCFYKYDLDLPEELDILEHVISNDQLVTFNFSNDLLSEISALIVVIADNSHQISLYKKLSPVEIVGRGGYMLWKANQRLERFNEQLLRITGKFQVLRVKDVVVILDLASIEKSFGFHDVIKREAAIGLSAIRELNLVSNLDTMEGLISNVSFARKLTKIARNSPVISNNIPNHIIIEFSKNHPATKDKMRYTSDHSQFELKNMQSKNLLIKILNDDLLTSDLTKLYYDSLAKDNVESV